MSKNTDSFDRICGDCAWIDLREVEEEDVVEQAKIYGASEDEVRSAILGLAEYQGVTETALAPFLLDEPAGEYGQFTHGMSYGPGEDVADDNLVEEIAERLGIEIEWAGSPEECEDGSGVWPFRVLSL